MTVQAAGAPPASSAKRTLVRSAGVVALIRGLDFGLSFLVSVLLANRFGASGQLDAFFLARRTTVGIADTIRKLVGQVVLPPVIAAVDRGIAPSVHLLPRRSAWFLATFALVMLAGMLVPGVLVSLFAPGFKGAQHSLTEQMMRIMMPLLPIAVVASLLAAILQARRKYLLSEGTNLVQRAILVLVLALFVPPLGIVAGAWTMLVSGVVGFLILLAGAWTIVRPRGSPARSGSTEDTPAPVKSQGLAAAIVINLYFQASNLLDFGFASTTQDGGVAALEYGSRLVSLVPGLVMSSLATVLAPELIRAVQHANRAEAAAGIQRFQRIALFAQLPVSVGMMLGAPLMVSALFGHGAFDATAIATAAACTAGYAAAAIFLAPMSAITSAIYADPHAPSLRDLSIIAILGLTIRSALLAVAAPLWGAAGIAWAAAAATAIIFGVAQIVAVRRFHHFHLSAQLTDLARNALCAAVAGMAGWALLHLVPVPKLVVTELALLTALGALVVLVYLGAALMLRVPEVANLRDIAQALTTKFRRRA
ncbi:polysaccharide biosynthesis C-terminal domain-containing protein [Sphingomonas sp. IC-56]|uniref:lipid II flippase MurJ n=1 Tax=Sphingomonas sp. IC-56 TaxID=2898529 RepID=UPI001E4CF25A|nr:lipid II flippase MurJ [Sphingomonas sp. IC-56]MCD2324342.1 polysaccharide biosynthesis C-terminal domain-containing protein [Sphingomonas sp. IC-56]